METEQKALPIARQAAWSMSGEEISQAVRGAQAFVSAMDRKDWLAWVAFDDQIYARTQGPKSETGEQLLSEIRSTTDW